jgi:hypothetical protein
MHKAYPVPWLLLVCPESWVFDPSVAEEVEFFWSNEDDLQLYKIQNVAVQPTRLSNRPCS